MAVTCCPRGRGTSVVPLRSVPEVPSNPGSGLQAPPMRGELLLLSDTVSLPSLVISDTRVVFIGRYVCWSLTSAAVFAV